MKNYKGHKSTSHDPADPNPWFALATETMTPIRPEAKERWLQDSASASRQYFLPFMRPLARLMIICIQILKIIVPIQWRASKTLHWLIVMGLKNFVRPDANYLILRHFHMGSEILAFIAKNVKGSTVTCNPLKPVKLEDLLDDVFLRHDLNLFNFILNLNTEVREKKLTIEHIENPDFSMISEEDFPLEKLPNGFLNIIDLETAIEVYTPVFQFFLTDNDFWRSVNSLQLDETIAIYAATILDSPEHLVLLNNRHPLVPLSTMRAGFRLVLHGLSTEMLHWLLVLKKKEQQQHAQQPRPI
ncbi:MAG: hypothetical protein IT287_01050 [Bdellovibrionaceae bacterium]|nr:hypothetical protein [Pseudobdellovibrionaceae bacterium]